MKRTALEEFLETMARAAPLRRKALKGLSVADAEEVLAATLLWCWENRAAFDQHKCTLSQWFYERMRNERTAWRRRQRDMAEISKDASSDANVEREVDTQKFVERLGALNAVQKRALEREMARDMPRPKRELAPAVVRATRAQLAPDVGATGEIFKAATQDHAPTAKKRESDRDTRGPAGIDHEIERMLRGPRLGMKECPPCVHCLWYYGYTAGAPRPMGRDPEVNAAIVAIEERKREIAQRTTRP